MKFAPICRAAALSSLPLLARGHGYLESPRSRFHQTNPGAYKNDPVYTLTEGPVFGFSPTAMRCRDRPALTPTTTVVAGGSINFSLNIAAYHIGDCAFYLSTPCSGAACDAPERWFKIANFPGCPLTGTIPIPPEVPASSHSVLRWEWSAHHVVSLGQVEFYTACHDVIVSSSAGPGRPEPLAAIAAPDPLGHLSRTPSDYRDAENIGRPGNMVGPDVASWTSCVAGTPGCIAPDGSVGPPPPATPPPTPSPTPPPAPTTPPPTPPPTLSAGPTNTPPCAQTAYGLCDVWYGVDYGCCAAGLVCAGATVKQCVPGGAPTDPPAVPGPTTPGPTARPTGAPTGRPSGLRSPAPTPLPTPDPTNPSPTPACTLVEFNACGSFDGFEFGCCAAGLVCEEVAPGTTICRPEFKCASWCSQYTTTVPDCRDCEGGLFV